MFNSKKTNVLIAILLVTVIFDTYSMMERRGSDSEKEQRGNMSGEGTFELKVSPDINLVRDILLGKIKLTSKKEFETAFMYLPTKVVSLLFDSNAQSIMVAGKAITKLARINPALNKLINDPVFCLQLIKHLAHKFNCSDETVAIALNIDETNNRLIVQKIFETAFTKNLFNQVTIDNLYTSYETFVDLNFTYKGQRNIDLAQNLLLATAYHDTIPESRLNKIKWLLNHSVNINSTDALGRTILMICALDIDIHSVEFLCQQPTIHINQQDNQGNTALTLVCTMRIAVSKYDPIIQILLDAGADPEIANNMEMTPLKEAKKGGNNNAVKLMQEAMSKKQSKK